MPRTSRSTNPPAWTAAERDDGANPGTAGGPARRSHRGAHPYPAPDGNRVSLRFAGPSNAAQRHSPLRVPLRRGRSLPRLDGRRHRGQPLPEVLRARRGVGRHRVPLGRSGKRVGVRERPGDGFGLNPGRLALHAPQQEQGPGAGHSGPSFFVEVITAITPEGVQGVRRSPSHCSGPASTKVRTANHSGAATTAPAAGVTVRRPQYWPLAAALSALTVTFSVADSPAPSVTEAGDTEAATPVLAPTVTAAVAV